MAETDIDALLAELTDQQRAFVQAYAACLNGAKAARAAHYSEASIYAIASENLRKPKIRAAIDALLAETAMPRSEILARLTDQGRGSMEDFLTVRGRGVTLDLKKAAERGVLHLIKKYSKTKQGTSIELYSAYDAQVKLGEHERLFVQRQELSGADGAPIEVSDARDKLAALLARRAEGADAPAGAGGDGGPDTS